MRQYLAIMLTAGFGLAVAAGMLAAAMLFGPKKRTHIKAEPFECGMPPAQASRSAVSVNFYLIAVLFVMFDIEIIFLYPWAVSLRTLGLHGFIAMAGFLFILFTALIYAIKRGALQWD
ncbi:MAG: NADH-quinone oxidoreductase subunit A [Elusimicrobiales bacterium]|jgi:NADH-quinone oxidoreductase subunit A